MPFPRSRALVMALLAALLAGALWWSGGMFGQVEDGQVDVASEEAGKPQLGLFATLPIYWGEVADVNEMLSGAAATHWVRTALESDYRLVPLDTLDGERGLAEMDRAILAQPRALSGAENVELDAWVRDGGRLLMFADPYLSAESRFHIGDRRRPQDVVLISPILARWGLELLFDEDQPDGIRTVSLGEATIPVSLAGHFVKRAPAGGEPSDCALLADGLVADCAIGAGRALIVADATLIENGEEEGGRTAGLDVLVERAFESSRGKTGKSRE